MKQAYRQHASPSRQFRLDSFAGNIAVLEGFAGGPKAKFSLPGTASQEDQLKAPVADPAVERQLALAAGKPMQGRSLRGF